MASLIRKKKGRNLYYDIVESARVNGKPLSLKTRNHARLRVRES